MGTERADDRIPLTGLLNHAATIRSADPLTVESIPAQWAYTVSLPVELGDHELPVTIAGHVVVHEGTLGAVVVASDLTTVLAHVPPSVGVGQHTIEVPVATFSAGARFILRNATAGNRPCVFTLEGVEVRAGESDALTPVSLLQSVSEGESARLNLSKLRRAVTSSTTSREWNDDAVFDLLRKKWSTVPAGLDSRSSSGDLLRLSDHELQERWLAVHREATTGEGFPVRGWYHTLYRDAFRDKAILDVGSGMGIDGVEFARHGARVTFVDIVESNLEVLQRLCRLFGVADRVRLHYLKNLASLAALPADYDVIWCQGSMINVPFDFSARESAELMKHLKPGGRWIELAYPRQRWERDGSPPFSAWGTMTDGEGTPWMEWYDLARLLKRLAPSTFVPALAVNFHNDDFNWFDLVRTS